MKEAKFELWVRWERSDATAGVEATSMDPVVKALLNLWRGYHARDVFKACWLVENQLREMREAGFKEESAKDIPSQVHLYIRSLS